MDIIITIKALSGGAGFGFCGRARRIKNIRSNRSQIQDSRPRNFPLLPGFRVYPKPLGYSLRAALAQTSHFGRPAKR